MKIYDVPIVMQVIMKVKAETQEQARMLAEKDVEQSNLSHAKTINADVQEPTDYVWDFDL